MSFFISWELQMEDMFIRSCTIVRVVDGDTVDIKIDLGFDITYDLRVRVYGMDTPERGQVGFKEASDRLKQLLPVGSKAIVQTFKDKKEKYGRYLANIKTDAFLNISDQMIAEGLAKPYFGGAK